MTSPSKAVHFDPATNVVQISRRMQADFGKQVCSPKEFEAIRETLIRIERDGAAQIVLTTSTGDRRN